MDGSSETLTLQILGEITGQLHCCPATDATGCEELLSSLNMCLEKVQQKPTCRKERSEIAFQKWHCFEIKNEKSMLGVFSERT